MTNTKTKFQGALEEAWEEHGLGSYREAALRIGVHHTVLVEMRVYGRIPGAPTLAKFADAISEPRSKWFRLAGYEAVPDVFAEETTAERIKERVSQYLINEHGMKKKDVAAMWEDLEDGPGGGE